VGLTTRDAEPLENLSHSFSFSRPFRRARSVSDCIRFDVAASTRFSFMDLDHSRSTSPYNSRPTSPHHYGGPSPDFSIKSQLNQSNNDVIPMRHIMSFNDVTPSRRVLSSGALPVHRQSSHVVDVDRSSQSSRRNDVCKQRSSAGHTVHVQNTLSSSTPASVTDMQG